MPLVPEPDVEPSLPVELESPIDPDVPPDVDGLEPPRDRDRCERCDEVPVVDPVPVFIEGSVPIEPIDPVEDWPVED